jgi:hypothetical protein
MAAQGRAPPVSPSEVRFQARIDAVYAADNRRNAGPGNV